MNKNQTVLVGVGAFALVTGFEIGARWAQKTIQARVATAMPLLARGLASVQQHADEENLTEAQYAALLEQELEFIKIAIG